MPRNRLLLNQCSGGIRLFITKRAYFATRSSHFSMKIMVNIEIVQATTNTVHVIQIGMDSYKNSTDHQQLIAKCSRT